MIKYIEQPLDDEKVREARLKDLLARIIEEIPDLGSAAHPGEHDYRQRVRAVATLMINYYGADAADIAAKLRSTIRDNVFPHLVLAEVEQMLLDIKDGNATLN